MRIESWIAELVDADPCGERHARLRGEDAVATAADAAHDDDAGATSDVGHATRVALRSDRRQEKTAEAFGLHVELDERRQRQGTAPPVLAEVSRCGHRHQRLHARQRHEAADRFRIGLGGYAVQRVTHSQEIAKVFRLQRVARQAFQHGRQDRVKRVRFVVERPFSALEHLRRETGIAEELDVAFGAQQRLNHVHNQHLKSDFRL